jgi:hypothetical protein
MKRHYSKALLLFFTLIFVRHSDAQKNKSMNFDVGQMYSKFSFKDDLGTKEKDLSYIVGGSYSLGYQAEISKGVFVRGGLGMRKAGATMLLDGMDITWNLQYLTANVGIGYAYNIKRFNPYVCIAPYAGYLLNGNQKIGTYSTDIKKEKSMKTSDFGICFSGGLKVTLSDYLAVYTEGKYMFGLQNIETTAGQKLYNRGFSINLGVAVSITQYGAPEKQKTLGDL